jgi:S1-C subfamily serine protease
MTTRFVFSCPNCQSHIGATPAQAGAKCSCPKCGQRLQVPAPPQPAPQPPAHPNRTVLGRLDPPAPPRVAVFAGPPVQANPVVPAHYKHNKRPSAPSAPLRTRPKAKPVWFWVVGGAAGFGLLVLGACLVLTLVIAFRGGKPSAPSQTGSTAGGDAEAEHHADQSMTPEAVFDHCGPSVAVIRSSHGSGSGFVVGENLIATNAHVVKGSPVDRLQVYFPSSDRDATKPFKVDMVVHLDRKIDLAILRVAIDRPALQIHPAYQFKPGQSATAIGSPGIGDRLLENAISTGVMSTKLNEDGLVRYQMNMAVNPGNSGGPEWR